MANYWERQVQSRLSRRRVLQAAGLGGAALASLSLLACGDDDGGGGGASSDRPFNTGTVEDSETGDELRARFSPNHIKDLPSQKEGPRYGGIHTFQINPPPDWNWAGTAAASIGFHGYSNNGLLGLFCDDMTSNLLTAEMEPMLVNKWERAGQTVVMHLEQNIKWHNVPPVNGRQFTSEDAAYVLEAYKKAPVQQFIMRDVDKIETPDKYTVRVSLKQPAAYFEQQLTTPYAMMFAREHAESSDGLSKRPIGTSAFVWESQQERAFVRFSKFKEFWRKDPHHDNKQLPYLDGINATAFADSTAAIAAFHSGQLDGISGGERDAWQSILRGHPEYVSTITPTPPANMPNVALRLDKAPWNDVRVRRAMSLAIDRPTIAAAFGGLGLPSYAQDWSYMGFKEPWTWDQLGQYQKFDPTQAKQLMSAAGFANGFDRKTSMGLSAAQGGQGYDIPFLAHDSWRKNLGLEIEIKPFVDNATFNRNFFGKQFEDLQANTYYTLGFEPDELSYGTNHSKAPSNFGYVNDPIMDELVLKQGNELNRQERSKILRQVMDRDLDQQFHLWLVALNQITVRQPYMHSYLSFLYGGPTSVSSHNSQMRWINKPEYPKA